MDFVRLHFTDWQWIFQPATFRLLNGIKYTPDFYDIKENVFIEVSGTRQAYSKGHDKYKAFRKSYPFIPFEVWGADNRLIEDRNGVKINAVHNIP
jgi:hypothetical protein